MMISHTARQKGMTVTAADILHHRKIDRIVQAMKPSTEAPLPPVPSHLVPVPTEEEHNQKSGPDTAPESQPFPLSPIQRLHFSSQGGHGDALDQQTLVLEVARIETIDPELLRSAFQQLLCVHPMLRGRFHVADNEEAHQTITPITDSRNMRMRFHSIVDTDYVLDCIKEARLSIVLSEGPLIAVDLFRGKGQNEDDDDEMSADRALLCMTIHHLVVDTVSWRIILQDLEGFLLSKGRSPMEPERGSFRNWCCAMVNEFGAPQEGSRYILPSQESPRAVENCWAMQGKSNNFGDAVVHSFHIDAANLVALATAREKMGFDTVDVLCAAVYETFSEAFGRTPQLFVEAHGREAFSPGIGDVSGVVGWFTSFSPLCVPENQGRLRDHSLKLLGRICQARRSVPSNGLAYFAQQQLSTRGISPMEITLNYLGAFQQLESESTGSVFRLCRDRRLQSSLADMRFHQRTSARRHSLISINIRRERDGLCGEITWNRHMSRQDDIRAWTDCLERFLSEAHRMLRYYQPGVPVPNPTPGPVPISPSQKSTGACDAFSGLPGTVHLSREGLLRVLDIAQSRYGLQRDDIESVYPCSPIQDSLMLSQLKDTNKTKIYDQNFLFEVLPPSTPSNSDETRIKPERLREAWQKIVQRHPIMRTIFLEDENGFLQMVLKQALPKVDVVILNQNQVPMYTHSDETEGNLNTLWSRHLLEERPHPLEGSMLHKLTIYEQRDDRASSRVHCVLTKNHLISGGQTSRLLIKELLDTYDGYEAPVREPYASYINYIYQQDAKEIAKWWTTYLDGVNACVFPHLRRPVASSGQKRLERNQERAQTNSKSRTTFDRVETTITDKEPLRLLCRKHEITTTAVFCAAWALTLRAYVNTDDVLFGLMFWGRDLPLLGAQTILGPMINLLPIRAKVPARSTAMQVCREFQASYIQQLSRQTLSLARIQQAARGQGSLGTFNTMVNIQRGAGDEEDPERTRAALLLSHDATEYDVALSITEGLRDLDLSIEFRTDSMSRPQAERLLQVYEQAVANIVASPACTLGDFNMATHLDVSVIRAWNSKAPETCRRCIHDMIHDTTVARHQAGRPAISSWDGELTYSELDLLSSKLAAMLVSSGARANDVVALCFEKSLWAVVSMLAVAKAGAAFMHVHPSHPYERAKAMMEQTKSRLGLASRAQRAKLSELVDGAVFAVGRQELSKLAKQDEGVYEHTPGTSLPSADPSHVMYMISTSGTTGTPKMVVIQHQSFCSAVAANRKWLQMDGGSRVLQFTDYCFDACLEEIFTVLVAGGCICIPSEEERLSGIPAFVKRHDVNWAAFTPSFLRTMQPSDIVPPVGFVTVHAEPVSQALVDFWAGRVHMRPSYGPTECSVTSTVGAPFGPGSDASNIGRPVGCHAWVVSPDNHDILMPVGAVGELVLQGPIVARGYLGDDEETAASFIPPPAWTLQVQGPRLACSDRMYKTGDLVRYSCEDGSLLIQQRKDDSQVKIRGQRIELREIEHHLDRSGVVQHGMALVPNGGKLQGRIVAVLRLLCLAPTAETARRDQDLPDRDSIKLVRRSDLGDDAAEASRSMRTLLESLARKLPRFMIPEAWLVVDKLPVQISHKTSRREIARWVENIDQDSVDLAYEFLKTPIPKDDTITEVERKVQLVWSQVLGIHPGRLL